MRGLWILGLLGAGCFAGCASRGPEGAAPAPAGSALLTQVRETTRRDGLLSARHRLVEGLAREDASRGLLERRVLRTTADPQLVLPDAWAALPASQRKRLAIAIVPGTRATNPNRPDYTRECLRGAAEQARRMGFASFFIETVPRDTVDANATLVASQLRRVFAQADAVVLVMLSKGAHDVVRYLKEDGASLPARDRKKLAVVLSLAGTVQGSVVADWMAHSPRPLAAFTRQWLRLSDQQAALGMLEEVGRSPWEGEGGRQLSRHYPNLTWISVVMVPDGADGRITERLWSPWARRRIEKTSPYYSPADGLVESAASVLPDEVEVPEWIVTGFGSHAVPNGFYRDGSRIAPTTTRPGREKLRPESGGEIMSAYLRALPASLLP